MIWKLPVRYPDRIMLPRLLLILTLAGASFAQDIASRLDQAVLPFVSNKQLMGSVLVARNGDVLLSKGYGFADLEWEVPNTPIPSTAWDRSRSSSPPPRFCSCRSAAS